MSVCNQSACQGITHFLKINMQGWNCKRVDKQKRNAMSLKIRFAVTEIFANGFPDNSICPGIARLNDIFKLYLTVALAV